MESKSRADSRDTTNERVVSSLNDTFMTVRHDGRGRGTFLQRLLSWKRQQAALLFSAWDIHDEGLVHVDHLHAILIALFPPPPHKSRVTTASSCDSHDNSAAVSAMPRQSTTHPPPHDRRIEVTSSLSGTPATAHPAFPAATRSSIAPSQAVTQNHSTYSTNSAFLKSCLEEDSGGPLPRPPLVIPMACLHSHRLDAAMKEHSQQQHPSSPPLLDGCCTLCATVHPCLCGCADVDAAARTSLRAAKEAYRVVTGRRWPVSSVRRCAATHDSRVSHGGDGPVLTSMGSGGSSSYHDGYTACRDVCFTLHELYRIMSFLFYGGASEWGASSASGHGSCAAPARKEEGCGDERVVVSVWYGFELMRGSLYDMYDVCARKSAEDGVWGAVRHGGGEGEDVQGRDAAELQGVGGDTLCGDSVAAGAESTGRCTRAEPMFALHVASLMRVGCHLMGSPMTRRDARTLLQYMRQRLATMPPGAGEADRVCCHARKPPRQGDASALPGHRSAAATASCEAAHGLSSTVDEHVVTRKTSTTPSCLTRNQFIHILLEC